MGGIFYLELMLCIAGKARSSNGEDEGKKQERKVQKSEEKSPHGKKQHRNQYRNLGKSQSHTKAEEGNTRRHHVTIHTTTRGRLTDIRTST